MEATKKVTIMGIPCMVKVGKYSANGQASISLVVAEDVDREGVFAGQPMMTASVCCPELPFLAGQTLIKNYSENEGLLDALIGAGVVEDLYQPIRVGHGHASLVRIL